MKYIKGLIKRKLNNWTDKQWYHQRFDGSPYFLHLVSEGEILTEENRKLGGDFTVHFGFFGKSRGDWYISMDDIKRVYTSIIKEGKKNPNISSDFIKLWQKEQDIFYKTCITVGKTDLSKLNNTELIKLHDDFVEIAVNKNSYSSLVDGFALGTDELIADKIKAIYNHSELDLKFAEVFSILTAPVRLSFINEAEIELLKVALNKKQLEQHQKNFFWIRNNYIDSYDLDIGYFEKELKKINSLNINIKDEIKKIESTPDLNKKKKDELMKKLKIDEELKLLIRISEDFTYWQDERKKSTFWSTHYFSLILDEISKRTDIPLILLKYMTPDEISNIFRDKPDIKELIQREKNDVYYIDKEGYEILSGKDADEIKKAVLGTTDLSQVEDFRGLTASTGKAIGRVKILKSVKEINKVEQGDILVAVMTRPDYVPAMRKAAAIVTDEGGITCHAAIVARELGIPCIIATKIATKVLNDDDLVEVNANHSWVRVLK